MLISILASHSLFPEGQYLLLGDDRLVSSDSRHVGTFKAKDIIGEAKFRFWPLKRIGTV